MEESRWTKDEIAAFDNEWLLIRLIFSYKSDIMDKEKRNWSEETCDLWEEAIARMKEPVVHGFDKKKYMDKLKEEYDDQTKILKSSQHTYSYHYGIKSGLDIAMKEFRKAIRQHKQAEGKDGNG